MANKPKNKKAIIVDLLDELLNGEDRNEAFSMAVSSTI